MRCRCADENVDVKMSRDVDEDVKLRRDVKMSGDVDAQM